MKTITNIESINSLEAVRNQVLSEFNVPDERHNFLVSSENISLTTEDVSKLQDIATVIPSFLNGFGFLRQICLYWR